MDSPDLNPALKKMLAEIAVMRAELNDLKQRAILLPQSLQPVKTAKLAVSTNGVSANGTNFGVTGFGGLLRVSGSGNGGLTNFPG